MKPVPCPVPVTPQLRAWAYSMVARGMRAAGIPTWSAPEWADGMAIRWENAALTPSKHHRDTNTPAR